MEKPEKLTLYHVHSMLSNGVTNIDSITDFHEYVDAAKKDGATAIGFSEHGSTFAWLKKKEYVEESGMKYIHAIEAYLTEDCKNNYIYSAEEIFYNKFKVTFKKYWQRDDGMWLAEVETPKDFYGKTLPIDINTLKKEEIIKTKDNYHCVLIAKNYEGVKEINKMISKSFTRNDYHFYYMPRISFDELFATSDNVLITTACLGGVLHKGTASAKEKFLNFLSRNKHRCWLEIQHHNCEEQIEYNKLLYELSKSLDIPLIAGTDTHALNDEHMAGRALLQISKNVRFANEDAWDLTFKTKDELIRAYKKQDSLPLDVVYEAIENTNCMADMVEEFKIDRSPKYPKLYPNSEDVFKQKINKGIIRRGIKNKENYKDYVDRIHYEYEVYKHNGAIDFMLLEENYKTAMRKQGIKFGYSRGSVSGSIIAYLLGITEIDSVKYNLNFERFMNVERVSLADIDTDWYSEDRKAVRDYLYNKEGLYCCDIVTFNTIALKGAIKDICRGFHNENLTNQPPEILKQIDEHFKREENLRKKQGNTALPMPKTLIAAIEKHSIHKEIPYDYLKKADEIIALAESKEEEARKKYPNVFRFVDLFVENKEKKRSGVVVSVGNHPAACVVSPYPVDEWFGTFTTSTNGYPISVLNMKEIDSLNFIKLDILGLDNIGLIYKTCEAVGIPFATPDNIPPDDIDVWNSIREDTTMIFQWESPSATAYLKQLFSDETIAKIKENNESFSYINLLSIGNGAIRPAGASYRDKLSQGICQDNGHAALNEFMKPTLGYCVYQEQVIEFLHSFCGYTMGEADIVRRGFAKKTGTEKFVPKIESGFIETMKNKYDVSADDAKKLIVNFLKVIEDASEYLFSKNHSDPYSWIGYICGYLRYYHPLEFITTALNIFADDEDKSLAIINYAKKHGIKISSIKFRRSTKNYSFNKETNEIYKGIASIKYLNEVIATELYTLKDNEYKSFVDLLYDLKEKTSLNARQLNILIDLDFFSEFGNVNYLRRIYNIFDKFGKAKQIKKDSLKDLGIDENVVRNCAGKETEKMFIQINAHSLIEALTKDIHEPDRKLSERIAAQAEHLGYIDIVDKQYDRMAVVVSLDTKYSPKLKMYSLKNGRTMDCKIQKKIFNRNKLSKGDIVVVLSTNYRPKSKKNDKGGWEPVPGTKELWLTGYRKLYDI